MDATVVLLIKLSDITFECSLRAYLGDIADSLSITDDVINWISKLDYTNVKIH